MTIYKILKDSEHFMEFATDLEEMLDEIGPHTGELEFMHFSRQNLQLAPYWKTFNGSFNKVRTGATATPDITCWRGATLVLSQEAYNTLAKPLAAYGEFLLINGNSSTPYYIFNCLQLADADEKKFEPEAFDGGPAAVKTLAFDTTSTQEKLVFKSKYEGCTAVFCSDLFQNIIDQSGFRGIVFRADLTAIF